MNKEVLHFLSKTVTLRRIYNLFKVIFSYLLSLAIKKPIIFGLPPIVMIEPTDICNLQCPMCPTGNGTLKREKGFMSFDLFKKIIDEVYEDTMMILLWNQGEPFLNKELIKMTKYASDKGLYVIVSTNGSIELNANQIVNSGIDTLIFSIDGITQESYEKYRVKGDLNLVLTNLKNIIAEKKRLRKTLPLIEWQFLVFKHNENQIDKVKKLAKKFEVDFLKLKTAQIYSANDLEYLPENPKYRRYKIKGNNFKIKFNLKNRCRRIWTQPVVNWNGEMAVCCFDKNNIHKIGNVQNENIKTIWNGKKYNDFRKIILTDRKSIPMCRNCGEGIKLKFIEKK